MPGTSYVSYSDSIEELEPGEADAIKELNDVVHRTQVILNDRYRHAVRFVHSKSHGIVKGELSVDPGLPPELAQGLFATAKTYPTIIRFSTAPGDIMADSVSTPKGMAMKVLGVQGEMLPDHAGNTTQDFVFVDSKTFAADTIKKFLGLQKVIVANLNDPELLKKIVSNTARIANATLAVIGVHSAPLEQLGAPEVHVLGQTFGSNAAIRYGDYIAKIAFTPRSENLKVLKNKHVGVNFHYSGLKDAVVDFFKTETAVWEVGVQLCTDLEKMPVENPSVEWKEDVSPYRPVGTITVRPQDAYSPARRVFGDEALFFTPWHALAAHRPLGRIMRARVSTYQSSVKFRQDMNGQKLVEPKSIDEMPD